MRYLTFLLLFTGSVAAQAVVPAEVLPKEQLRGIPPTVRLSLKGTALSSIPTYFTCEAILPDGRTYLPFDKESGRVAALTVPEQYVSAEQPRDVSVLEIPLGLSLGFPDFFVAPELRQPGKYRIRLILDDRLVSGKLPPDPVLVTELAEFSVVPGTADDIKVWERMIEVTHGVAPLLSMSRSVVTNFVDEALKLAPRTAYLPYLLLAKGGNSPEESLSILNEVRPMLIDSNPPAYDYASMTAIQIQEGMAIAAYAAGRNTHAAEVLAATEAELKGFLPRTDWGRRRALELRRALAEDRALIASRD